MAQQRHTGMSRKSTAYGRRAARLRAANVSLKRDGITMARMLNTRLTPAEVERIIAPCRQAVKAFQTGSASYAQWVTLCTAGHVAEAIEDGGVIRGQRQIIQEADAVLDAIGEAAGNSADTWRPITLRGLQITALADLVAAHSRQVRELTYGEYTRAADKAVARVATDGGQVFRMEEATL
jgi:hypothetical protein